MQRQRARRASRSYFVDGQASTSRFNIVSVDGKNRMPQWTSFGWSNKPRDTLKNFTSHGTPMDGRNIMRNTVRRFFVRRRLSRLATSGRQEGFQRLFGNHNCSTRKFEIFQQEAGAERGRTSSWSVLETHRLQKWGLCGQLSPLTCGLSVLCRYVLAPVFDTLLACLVLFCLRGFDFCLFP